MRIIIHISIYQPSNTKGYTAVLASSPISISHNIVRHTFLRMEGQQQIDSSICRAKN
jgi:hypothetical protein